MIKEINFSEKAVERINQLVSKKPSEYKKPRLVMAFGKSLSCVSSPFTRQWGRSLGFQRKLLMTAVPDSASAAILEQNLSNPR